jgi:hypothetical protein
MSTMPRHGWQKHDWQPVADHQGRPLGKYKTPIQPLREEVEVVKKFLIGIQKCRKGEEQMSKTQTTEKTNMCFIAGTLKFDPKVFDTNTKCLVDTGMKSGIECSIFTGQNADPANEELAKKLSRFKKDDFIKLVCMLRPYGVKKDDGTWSNRCSIDITAIKNDPPKRNTTTQADDDVPF